MKRFLSSLIIVSIPILLFALIIVILYVVVDPSMFLRHHDDYNDCKSRAFRSAILLENSKIKYNSFIVGSSRGDVWSCSEWEQYLDPESKCFHLTNNSDCVYEARERLMYIYKYAPYIEEVKNVILLVDHIFLTRTEPADNINSRCPWQMSINTSWLEFQYEAFKYSLSWVGLKYYLSIGEDRTIFPFFYDERNERYYVGQEAMITYDSIFYHSIWSGLYDYKRDSLESIGDPIIGNESLQMLSDIHNLFIEGNTQYAIVVNPLYDQVKLNPKDKAILDSIFGETNVYDYSGINDYTSNMFNYYESRHYRPQVSKQILKEIYEGR